MNVGQFVEISQPNVYLNLYRGFLEVSQNKKPLGRIPLDDILGLVVTGFGCSHSSNVLAALAERGIPVSICGSNFMPKALVFPLVGNVRQKIRMQSQAEAGQSLKKQIWRQIIQLKLKNQALVLKEHNLSYEGLWSMSKLVRSGDSQNLEAQGARRYWTLLFNKTFKRDKNEKGVNSLLNYVYMIIRSCTARATVSAGLHPSLGIHHHNMYNPMCLVDDLMEPFRPIGDHVVKQLDDRGLIDMNKEVKTALSKIAVVDIVGKKGITPLFHVISDFVFSFCSVLQGNTKNLDANWKVEWKNLKLDKLRKDIISNAS